MSGGPRASRRPRTARAAGYVVLLVIQPWTSVVLILVADGRVAYTLLPWESWLRAGSSPPRITTSSGRARDPGAPAGKELTL